MHEAYSGLGTERSALLTNLLTKGVWTGTDRSAAILNLADSEAPQRPPEGPEQPSTTSTTGHN